MLTSPRIARLDHRLLVRVPTVIGPGSSDYKKELADGRRILRFISLVQFGTFVALLNGAYTLWTIFAKPKVRMFLGDSINIVIPPREVADRFHIGCNFVNSRAKVAAVHHLEAIVVDPQKCERRFQWNLFFEYAQGATHVQKKTDPFPIAVLPRSSAFHFIEFKLEGEKIKYWPQGRYEFNIIGWANR